MGTHFNQCPNCGRNPPSGMFGKGHMDICECKQCGTISCRDYCGPRCPNCGCKEKAKIGYATSKR